MRIGIGIDTGGTCTDAVAYDFETGKVLAKGKVLTTRENLSIGIGGALDALPQELVQMASLISLSTTLATNACVENKGCRAKLLIFGMRDEMLIRTNAEKEYGLKSSSVRCIDTHGSYDGLRVDEPDWEAFVKDHSDWLADADAVAAAEMYSMNNGAVCEKQSKKLLEEGGLPFVAASELSSDINVLARGATALLNARLLPIVREFIEAAISDFAKRKCTAPVMIVRSDGSLMSSALSLSRPVETIVSGPAASVLAGRSFVEEEDYLVVDMGGTTTDVSVVSAGRPAMAEGGIKIGGWRTQVKGVFVDTFALGGDSAVQMTEGKIHLSPRRAMPVCVAAKRWPQIKTMLSESLSRYHPGKFPSNEFLYLVREPSDEKRYNEDELTLIKALKQGPCALSAIKDIEGLDIYHVNSERLESEGIVMRCGLTPTDFMHIKGDYTEYDAEASVLAARYLLRRLQKSDTAEALSALADEVYGLVEGRMYENLLRILIMQRYPSKFSRGIDAQTEFLIRESWQKRGSDDNSLLDYKFTTKSALVGIGAPTHVFLPAVAKALSTVCVTPEHAEVANALGALKADIDAVCRVEVSKVVTAAGDVYYIVHAPAGSRKYLDYNETVAAAKAACEEAALKEARARGALGELKVETSFKQNSSVSKWGNSVDMGFTVFSKVTVRIAE